jgi:LysW-gamma-L-alpha-aminoadipyl-6-phosphate/LysW-L-glutamyl-5-phosphate reductase
LKKIDVSIVGASGYVGGELLRLLLKHPNVNLKQASSETYKGQFIKIVHPNLRQFPIKFSSFEELENCDVLFLCLPHGTGMEKIKEFIKKGRTIIDLSADFRLNDPKLYEIWYGLTHTNSELLNKKVLGLPEIYSDTIKKSKFISCPGCMSTTAILGLYPLVKAGVLEENQPIIVEAKTGSTGAGNKLSKAGLHAQRSGAMRSFKATGHRHSAEITQELTINGNVPRVHFSATAVEAVRGILTTSHVFLKPEVTEADIWGIYREFVKDKPFLRIVKEQKGNFRYPEPKILIGTNICEIGFEKDPHSNRLVVMSALDNLMKGAAGQAVQCLNINQGWEEETGLETVGLFPI